MAYTVKELNPIVKDVLGVAKALKIDREDFGKDREDLQLVVDEGEAEKRYSFQYNPDKDDYRIYKLPQNLSEEQILDSRVEG